MALPQPNSIIKYHYHESLLFSLHQILLYILCISEIQKIHLQNKQKPLFTIKVHKFLIFIKLNSKPALNILELEVPMKYLYLNKTNLVCKLMHSHRICFQNLEVINMLHYQKTLKYSIKSQGYISF
jgi:hypothetical protein